MKITALEEYGLRCVLRLAMAQDGGPLTVAEIASSEGLTVPYVGKLMSVLRQSGLVPPLVTHMIAVGERSGELEAMLGKVADSYEQEVESTLGTLTAILEPVTIVVMGGIVLFIVLAILLPIFEINALVR